MSGIINIVLHKNQLVGFNGALNANWSKEINPKFNSGFNYRFGSGKYRAKARKQRDNDEKSGGGGGGIF